MTKLRSKFSTIQSQLQNTIAISKLQLQSQLP